MGASPNKFVKYYLHKQEFSTDLAKELVKHWNYIEDISVAQPQNLTLLMVQ